MVVHALAIFITLITVLLVVCKLYISMTTGVYKGTINMKGKTVIITGCNSGIGKETAKDLANRGARVIMACRNMVKGLKAKDEIIKESGNCNVELIKLDLISFDSVRQFATKVNQNESRLDVLINNAGVANYSGKELSEDDIELTMATNHYGPFLLTNLLLPLLKKTPSSRIIVVTSILYRFGKFKLTKPNPTSNIYVYLYCISKYANIIFTIELARRLKESNSDVTCNCLHPGVIYTGIWRNVPFPLNYFFQFILKSMWKTINQGAQTSIYLAVSEDVSKISGKYFKDCKVASLRNDVLDEVYGKKFWEICEKVVKLQPYNKS